MASIEINNPGRVALVEMHVVNNSYGMYCAEALQRMLFYPAPVYSGGSWGYYTPYLWYDGHKGSTGYTTWQSQIQNRMLVDAPVTITMWGDWDPAMLTGTVYAKFRNDTTETLNGLVNFVVTEDSIYRVTPYEQWHNHVARDYLPNQVGESVSLAPGDSVIKSRAFTLNSIWNPDMIEFVAWIQNPTMAADSTKEIWQGATLDIVELGIAEFVNEVPQTYNVAVTPNPCSDAARFTFTLPSSAQYEITVYDISGRVVRTFLGSAAGSEENIAWNLRDEEGVRVSSGIYLYRFESNEMRTTGKVVVR